MVAGCVQLFGHRTAGVAALHSLTQAVHQLALAGHALLAGRRVGGVEVVQVVADDRATQLQRSAGVQLVVRIGERLSHLRPDQVLDGFIGFFVAVHRIHVLRPVQPGSVGLCRGFVSLSPPVGPIGVCGGVAKHIGRLALRLRGVQSLHFGTQRAMLGAFLCHVAVEVLAQRPLVLAGQLANRLECGHAVGVLRQSPVQRIDAGLVDLKGLAVERASLPAVARLNELVGVSVELVGQRLAALLLASGVLHGSHGVKCLAVGIGLAGSDLLKKRRALDVGHDVARGVAVSGASADVVAQRLLQVFAGGERLGQPGSHARLQVHGKVGPIRYAQRQPAVFVLIAADDGKISLNLLHVVPVHGLSQAIQPGGVDRQERVARHSLQRVVAALQADGPHALDSRLHRHLAKRSLPRCGGATLERHGQRCVGFHLSQGLPQNALGIAHGSAAAGVQFLRHLEVGSVCRLANLDFFGGIHEFAGLPHGLGAGLHVAVQVEVLHALGDTLHVLGHVGVQAPGQHLRGPGNAQHVHHTAVDQCIAASSQRQTVDAVVGPDADVLAQRVLGPVTGQSLELGQEGRGLRRAQVVVQVFGDLGVIVRAGCVLQHKRLGLGRRLVDLGRCGFGLLLHLLEPLCRLQKVNRVFGVGQCHLGVWGGRLSNTLQFGLDQLGRLTSLDGRLALSVGLAGVTLGLGGVGLGFEVSGCQACVLGPALEVLAETQAARVLGYRVQVLHRQCVGVFGFQRHLADAGLHARGVVGHQFLALQVHGLQRALHDGPVVLVSHLRLGGFAQVCVVSLWKLELGLVPAQLFGDRGHKLALMGALLIPQSLLRLVLGLQNASFFVLGALRLGLFGFGLLFVGGFLFVLGFLADAAQLEVVQLTTRAADHMGAAIGLGLDQDWCALTAGAVGSDRDPSGPIGDAGFKKQYG